MNSDGSITFESKIHFSRVQRGRRKIKPEAAPVVPIEPGVVPRLSRLMALAIRFEKLVRDGKVKDYAELARVGGVTRARMAQIMNLLNLAPDIQEEILFMPKVACQQEAIPERRIRKIVATADWARQKKMWGELKSRFD